MRAVPTTTTWSFGQLAPIIEYLRTIERSKQAVDSANVQVATTASRPKPETERCAYADLIRDVWQQDAEWAIGIAWRESRCQPTAHHPEGASGIFQMMMPMHADLFRAVGCAPEQWTDPACNVRAAWLLYQGSGRRPWRL